MRLVEVPFELTHYWHTFVPRIDMNPMFKNANPKDTKATQEAMNSNNIIGKGSTFKGDVQTYGNMRIEGKVIGDIISKSKIVVGHSAIVEGNLRAQLAEIEGEVHGSLEVTDTLILKPKCKITGDILTNKLIVESGAQFDGQCKMGNQNLNKIVLPDEKNGDTKKLKEAI